MQFIRIDEETFDFWRDNIESLISYSISSNFRDYPVAESYVKDKCNQLKAHLHDGSAVVFAAIAQNKLCGWVWCHEIQRPGKRRLHVSEIAVSEECRRQGIGSKLLGMAEKYAVQHNIFETDLLVTAKNSDAVSFYANASYETERYLMRKKLTETDAT